MPRTERPLENDGSALSKFASDLRVLREKAGSPPYRELARQAHFSSTTLSDAAGGRRLPSLAVTLAYVAACGGDRDEWERCWRSVAAELSADQAAREPGDDQGAPYVGLRAYGPDDTDRFFGRERLVDDLVERVRRQRFVAVFGPSGCGKTSVLRAGLVPVLADAPGPVVVFSPGARPITEVAAHIATMLGATAPSIVSHLNDDAESIVSLFRQILLSEEPGATLTLVVDQFEEIFTLCADEEERTRFVAVLLDAADRVEQCRIVLGVRADFYSHCALQPGLADALQDAQVTVGPMGAEEIRRAIVRPAAGADCAVESALLTTLVAHAYGQVGVLPMLSHALLETWRRRKGHTLTLAGFEAAGGLDGALSRTAEMVYSSLTTRQQEVARQLFRRLAALGDGTADTKRPIETQELDGDPDTGAVLEELAGARLVVMRQGAVELAHEALIEAWPRLRGWLNTDRDGHRIHRQLTDAAAAWELHERDEGTLLRGARLMLISAWAGPRTDLTQKERAFLDASMRADAAERFAVRRRIRRQRTFIAMLSAMVLVAAGLSAYAVRAEQNATRLRDSAIARKTLSDIEKLLPVDPDLAAQLSLVADRLESSVATQSSVITAAAAMTAYPIEGEEGRIGIAQNGKTAAVSSEKYNSTTLFDLGETRQRAVGSIWGLLSSFSGDGRSMVSVGKDKKLDVWDIADLAHPTLLATLPTLASGGVVDNQRRYLISGGVKHEPFRDEARGVTSEWTPLREATLWDIGDPQHPKRLNKTPLKASGFTFGTNVAGDATVIVGYAEGGDGQNSIEVWRPEDISEPARPLMRPGGPGYNFRVSPNGQSAITMSFTSPARLATTLLIWDLAGATRPRYIGDITHQEVDVSDSFAVNHEATKVAILRASGGLLDFWPIVARSDASVKMSIAGPNRKTVDMAFSADDSTLLAIVRRVDNTAEVWHWKLDSNSAGNVICQNVSKEITAAQWADYFAELPYEPPCDRQ